MEAIIQFVQAHRPYFDVAHALSSVVSLTAWTIALLVILWALFTGRMRSVTVAGMRVDLQEETVADAVDAARVHQADAPEQKIDVARIRSIFSRAFEPTARDNLLRKSILWVDDRPANNELAVRAFRKIGLDVAQVTSTEAALEALRRRPYHLIISDMGRGENMRAGYELLEAVRQTGNTVPFAIFAGSDSDKFRAEAHQRGAQLSTNDIVELYEFVTRELERQP